MSTARSLLLILAVATGGFVLGYQWELQRAPGSTEDPEAVAQSLRLAMRSVSEREQAELMLPVLTMREPAELEALAPILESEFTATGGDLAVALFAERWAQIDPQTAHARVSGWPADRRRFAWPPLLRAWARTRPDAALRALDDIQDGSVRARSQVALVEGWADSGDPGVWSYLPGISDDSRRRQMSIDVMHQIALQQGLEGLIARLESLPEGSFKQEMIPLGADVIARIDMSRALVFAAEALDGPYAEDVLLRVAGRRAGEDGRATMLWLRGLPDGEGRDGAMYGAYTQWLRAEPREAIAWLEGADQAADLVPAYRARATRLTRSDPVEAAAWADAIADPTLQLAARLQVGRTWQRRDPAAATRWIDAVGLTEAIQQPETSTPAPE